MFGSYRLRAASTGRKALVVFHCAAHHIQSCHRGLQRFIGQQSKDAMGAQGLWMAMAFVSCCPFPASKSAGVDVCTTTGVTDRQPTSHHSSSRLSQRLHTSDRPSPQAGGVHMVGLGIVSNGLGSRQGRERSGCRHGNLIRLSSKLRGMHGTLRQQ